MCIRDRLDSLNSIRANLLLELIHGHAGKLHILLHRKSLLHHVICKIIDHAVNLIVDHCFWNVHLSIIDDLFDCFIFLCTMCICFLALCQFLLDIFLVLSKSIELRYILCELIIKFR